MSQIGHTATNASRFDDLCEQLTCASEFLTVAQKYTELKEQGVKNFQYTTTVNGKESTVSMPLEDVLDMYPGLRKAVTENGFSADNPQSVQAVLQASANYWKEYRSSQYYIQNIEAAQAADNIQKECLYQRVSTPYKMKMPSIKKLQTRCSKTYTFPRL